MSTDAQMQFLYESSGRRWYFAEPGRFERPGLYFWNGTENVHIDDALAPPLKPEAAEEAASATQAEVVGSTVYVLNERGTNRWWASVQPGQDDNGERISDEECQRIAHALASRAQAQEGRG